MLIVGNWKMYKTGKEAVSFIETLTPLMTSPNARVMLAVPFTAIGASVHASKKGKISIGAQNMHDADEGAFTGEVSARMLKEAGAEFVLLGHSERRHYFHETNALIQKKVKRALSASLKPILCIGETEKERESGKTEEVLTRQLKESLQGFSAQEVHELILAYEPVWAIGTGKTATPQMADEAHALCLRYLQETFDEEVPVLYGGSVKPENAKELLQMPNIDGALVGGASLDPRAFAQIINAT